MSKLIIKLNADVVDHVELRQGDMKLGRKLGCEIQLDNLSVSGEHANIFTIGEDSFIQDLASTNGVYINGKKVAKHHLKNGDTVTIGKYTLVFVGEAEARPAEDAKTVAITAPVPPEEPRRSAAAAKPAASPLGQAALINLGGRQPGKRIELTKTVTSLGKAGKRAAVITRTPDGYQLTPGKDETPKLNGRPVSGKHVKLRNGDIIELAGTRLQFHQR